MNRIILILVLSLTGCTHYPHLVAPSAATPDSSTPVSYPAFNSGYIGKFTGRDGKTYDAFTKDWRNRHPEIALIPFTDQYGNLLYAATDEQFSQWYAKGLNTP